MPAVWLRFRAELRQRWRAWIGLGLLLGFSAGVVAGVAVGARRTSTVAARFQRELAGYDATVSNFPDPGVATFDPARIEALPMVTASARVRLDYVGRTGNAVLYTAPDGRFGTAVERAKVLAGRLPDPQHAGEVAIVSGSQEALGTGLGGEVPLIDPAELDDAVRPLLRNPTVRVVGIVAVPNMVSLPRGQAPGGLIVGTPALHEQAQAVSDAESKLNPDFAPHQDDGVVVRLRRGADDIPAFQRAVEQLPHEGVVRVANAADANVNLRRSTHLQAVTLWLLGALLTVVGLASILATMRQSANADAADSSTLRALGITRGGTNALAVFRGLVIGLVGAIVGCILAVALSSRMLFGVARLVEPNEGVVVDWTVLGLVVVAVLLLGVVSTVIGGALARRASRRQAPVLRVPAATSVPAGVGVRFACSGWSLLGRGIAGPAIGIAALAAALVFGASLTNLRHAPRLYGWQWDVVATNYGSLDQGPRPGKDPGSPAGIAALRGVHNVDGIAVGSSLDARVGGAHVFVLTLDTVRGEPSEVLPPIAEGAPPIAPGEIALAARTMESLHARIGDHIEMTADGGTRPMTATVVGRVVMPPVLGTVQPGQGALMPNASTLGGFGIKTGEEIVAAETVYARVVPGASAQTVLADLNKSLGGDGPELYEVPRVQPRDLVDFGRVDAFPLLLGAVLAILAASTLLHVLVSSVRLRRHDMATLRAFGIGRSQLGGVIAAQATFLAVLAVVVGLPLGIAAGRIAWSVYAQRSGFISVVRVPLLGVLLLGGLAIVAAELCAAIPAHIASRTRPAQLLRSE